MCERHYRRAKSTGSTDDPRIDNLHRHKADEHGCHMWQGPTYRNGYGKMSRKVHGTRLPHRAAYIERFGPVPAGLDVHHTCHQGHCVPGADCPHRRCMNAEHLRPASRSINLMAGDGGFSLEGLCKNRLHDITQPGSWRWATTRVGESKVRVCVACLLAKGARANARRRKAA